MTDRSLGAKLMATVSTIMTTDVQVTSPHESLQSAAQLMDQLNVGSLPVCEGGRLVGIVTDRDITTRGTAAGLLPAAARVEDVMTRDVESCTGDAEIERVMTAMGAAQVRRMPVVDADRYIIGIVSLGDIATRQTANIDGVVRQISTPSEPDGGPANS